MLFVSQPLHCVSAVGKVPTQRTTGDGQWSPPRRARAADRRARSRGWAAPPVLGRVLGDVLGGDP